MIVGSLGELINFISTPKHPTTQHLLRLTIKSVHEFLSVQIGIFSGCQLTFSGLAEWRCKGYQQLSANTFDLAPSCEHDALADLIDGHPYFL
jgi:hypothetical protein